MGALRRGKVGVRLVVALSVVGLAACSMSTGASAPTSSAVVSSSSSGLAGDGSVGGDSGESSATASASSSVRVVAPKPPTSSVAVQQRDGVCPWIATQTAADLEGNRIGQVIVSRRGSVVLGCEFHFDTNWGPDRVTLRITATSYGDSVAARNAMIRLGLAGRNASGQPSIAPGVDGIRYQTELDASDATPDWAFSFAKGRTVVTVKTDQDRSTNAYNIGLALLSEF